jgi:TRL (tRNA-associated locus)-like protein
MTQKLLILFILTLFISGCVANYQAPVKPGMGFLFCNFKAPLMVDLNETDVDSSSIHASSKKIYYFHDIIFTGINVAWDTADIPEIAQKAGIKEVTYADYELLNILGIYAEFTIHVYGR